MADPITLAIGLGGLSAATSIAAGEQANDQGKAIAASERLNARLEQVQAKRDSEQINRDLERVESSQNALFSARGFLQGEGSSVAARTASRDNATRSINERRFGADIASSNALVRGASARSTGSAQRTASYAQALRTGSSLFAGGGGGGS